MGHTADKTKLGRAPTLRAVSLGEIISVVVLVLVHGSVEVLLKDGLGLVELPLGLEVAHVVRDGGRVGASSVFGECEALTSDVVLEGAPIALTTAVLLNLLGVDVGVARFGKEARQVLGWGSSAVCETLVVTVVGLCGASHDSSVWNVKLVRRRGSGCLYWQSSVANWFLIILI